MAAIGSKPAAHSTVKEAVLGLKYELKIDMKRVQEIYFPSLNIIFNSEGNALFRHESRNKELKGKCLVANPLTNILVNPAIVKEITNLAILQSQQHALMTADMKNNLEQQATTVHSLTKNIWG